MKHKRTENSKNKSIADNVYGNNLSTNVMILLIFSSITIIYIYFAYYIVHNGNLTTDEGFYIMAAKKVINGAIPYRDFGYTQTPILPYINGFLMKIFGFEQQVQRAINMSFGYLAVITSMFFVLKWRGLLASFICGLVLLSSPYWVGQNYIGTYGVTGFVMALTGAVFCSPLNYNKKVFLFSVLGIIAVGCRLTVAPTVIILWIFLVLEGADYKQKFTAIIVFIAVALATFLPFFLASPSNFIFWNIEYHLNSAIQRRIIYEHILGSPSIFIMIFFAISILIISNKKLSLIKKLTLPEVAILLAAIIGIISQMVLKTSYACYSMLFATLVVMGGSVILADFKWKKYIYLVFIIFPLIYLTPLSPFRYLPLPVQLFLDDGWNSTLNDAKIFLQEKTQADDLILTSFPIVAIEADRSVFPGMEMGIFGITDEMDETKAKKLNFMHYNELINIVENQRAKAIILEDGPLLRLNMFMSLPSWTPVSAEKRMRFAEALLKNYQIVYHQRLVILMPN